MAVRRARETWWRRVGAPLLTHAVLIAGCVVMLFPYLWMVGTSFKPADETMLWPPRIFPIHWTWANYPAAMEAAPFVRFFLNSLLVSVGADPDGHRVRRCSPGSSSGSTSSRARSSSSS